MKNISKVTLVGAGPGDAELITLKGIKALQTADVVLYDALVSKELLNYVPVKALKIYVGKRAAKHEYPQKDINRLIVEYAFTHGHVVRLKGGDPFVFGRGQEEVEYAHAFGIQTSVVPGISSAISVPALQGIPVTSRGISQSFWVLTATTSNGSLNKDLQLAAESNATVIVLMGTQKLSEIVRLYKNLGRSDLPIAVIQNGSLPNEKLALGNIHNIVDVVNDRKIGAPAIIIIGEVVSLHPENRLSEVIQEQIKRFNH